MARIFISYRRSDSPDAVGRLRDRMIALYGGLAIFRDIDDIPKGTRFKEVIDAELAECEAMFVVIGPGWLNATDAEGNRRLDQPGDWPRQEIEAGLSRPDIRIFPVFVSGATLPKPSELPESIRALLDWNATWLRDDSFDADFAALAHDVGLPFVDGAKPLVANEEPPPAGNRRIPVVIAGVIAAVLVLGGAFLALRPDGGSTDQTASGAPASRGGGTPAPTPDRPPTDAAGTAPMTGGFNVAVADFAPGVGAGAAASTQTRQLAQRVAKQLRSNLGGDDIEVRGPDQVGAIAGSTRAERQQAAEKVANDIGADLVIVGRVDFDDPSRVSPEILLTPNSLADTPELGGYYTLDDISAPGGYTNQVTRSTLVNRLSNTTSALSRFIEGVSYYALLDADAEQGDRAREAFEAALGSPDFPTAAKEWTFTFLGGLALYDGNADEARFQFEQAVGLNPGSVRGRLGLAEVQRLDSSGSRCASGTVDPAGLDAAIAAFAAIRPAPADGPGPALKAELGRATAERCKIQAGLGGDGSAVIASLRDVIADAGSDPDLTDVVARAHAELALALAPPAGATDPAGLEASRRESAAAVAVTQRRQDKAVYLWQQAFYLMQMGREPEAADALRQAAALIPEFGELTTKDLVALATGPVAPSAGETTPPIVSRLNTLPATGTHPLPLATLGLALVIIGLTLERFGRRVGRRGPTGSEG